MKVISFNANGIRSAAKKGFFDWVGIESPDILCIQEVRCPEEKVPQVAHLKDYICLFNSAQKPGYSGTATYLKIKDGIKDINFGLGFYDSSWGEIDKEARIIYVEYEYMIIINVYIPSGTSSPARQEYKMNFLSKFSVFLDHIRSTKKLPIIICGDFNIAHTSLDIKNDRANRNKSGFLPEEKDWLTDLLSSGFRDVYRGLYPDKEQYTWWSNRANAWANNVGWRIDYQIATETMASVSVKSYVYRDKKYSDHAPLVAIYD